MTTFNCRALASALAGFCALALSGGVIGSPAAGTSAQAANCSTEAGQASRRVLVVPFINDVPESSRLLQTHRYGARYIEIKRGAISLDHTLLDPYHENIFLTGRLPASQVADKNAGDNLSLVIRFRSLPAKLQFMIGVEFADGFVSVAKNGDWAFDPKAYLKRGRVAQSKILPWEKKLLAFGEPVSLAGGKCNSFSQPGLSALSSKHGRVEKWFFIALNPGKTPIEIGSFGLEAEAKEPASGLVSGEVRFDFRPQPALLKVLYENNEERIVHLSLDHKFAFLDEFPDSAMSLVLVYGHNVAYPVRGRWLGRDRPRGPIKIRVRSGFQNLTATLVDPKTVIKQNLRSRIRKNPIGYFGHAAAYWTGSYNRIQEFENRHFTNYHGFHDRDWDEANRNKCLRVAHIGQSIVQARQVTVSQKHSLLASEKLSVQLGRCVEVASFSSGFTPSSRDKVDWIVKLFKPDVLLFSAHRQMMQLTTPETAKIIFGESHGHAHFDSAEVKDGKLVFVPQDPKHHLAKKTKRQNKINGIPSGLVFNVPFEVMPGEGLRAFEALEALMTYYKTRYAKVTVALEYSHTVAGCHKARYCRKNRVVNGKSYQAGARGFVKNMEALCKRSVAHCVSAKLILDADRTYPDFVFQYDTHLSAKGNAWQAEILTRGLKPILAKLVQ